MDILDVLLDAEIVLVEIARAILLNMTLPIIV